MAGMSTGGCVKNFPVGGSGIAYEVLHHQDRTVRIRTKSAFPNSDHFPASLDEPACDGCIPFPICMKLLFPESRPGFRHSEVLAIGVRMPEATVDEDHRAPLWQYKIGSTRQILHVQAKAESARPEARTYKRFRLGITAANERHHSRTYIGSNDVRHKASSLERR